VTRRQLLFILATLGLLALGPSCRRGDVTSAGTRIVSLAPAVTETLFTIGAGSAVVAVSDYCDSPPEVKRLPRVGTSITPNYEAIARLAPTLVVSEANVSTRKRELEALAPTRLLPWLTLQEIAGSIRELGQLSGKQAAASALADKLLARLSVPESPTGPRVLLVLGGESSDSTEIWFVRRNSLHGAALRAAGARNAVAENVSGPPQLSHERLLQLDPEFIIVLTRPEAHRANLAGFERFTTLQAVKAGHVALLAASEAFANGPRILTLVERLHAELVRLGALP
jgi:ABC-type Fe3+-hydroxamate transport system substrate-binding protein